MTGSVRYEASSEIRIKPKVDFRGLVEIILILWTPKLPDHVPQREYGPKDELGIILSAKSLRLYLTVR